MKNKIMGFLAKAVVTLTLFTALLGVGTASALYMYQPEVPESLLK